MLHFFRNRNPALSIEEASSIVQLTINTDDSINYPGYAPRAVDSAIVRFPRDLLEQCAESHALVYVPPLLPQFASVVNRARERLVLTSVSVGGSRRRAFQFGYARPGYRLIRLSPPPEVFGKTSVEQEDALGLLQSGESIAGAYVAVYAATSVYDKYKHDITGGLHAMRTSDHVGPCALSLVPHGSGHFSLDLLVDKAASNIGAIGMIESFD